MKLLLPIIIVLVLAGGYFVANQSIIQKKILPTQSPSPSPPSLELKTFQSKTMKFSIDLPDEFLAEEKLGSVTISTPEGEIYIDKNGTNFDSLEPYLKDLSLKNRFSLVDRKNLAINELSSISGTTGEEKTYFIYKNNMVYTLNVKIKGLHDDLDQIAQSFRYTP